MRRKILFLLTVFMIITVGCISGCGGCGCNDGHDQLDTEHYIEDLDRLSQESSSDQLPSEAELGVPVYGENVDPSSVESSKSETDGEVTDAGVDYSSKDDFETVVSWYKNQLGEPDEFQQLPNGHYQAWWNLEKDGMSIQVILTCTDEGTAISILTAQV